MSLLLIELTCTSYIMSASTKAPTLKWISFSSITWHLPWYILIWQLFSAESGYGKTAHWAFIGLIDHPRRRGWNSVIPSYKTTCKTSGKLGLLNWFNVVSFSDIRCSKETHDGIIMLYPGWFISYSDLHVSWTLGTYRRCLSFNWCAYEQLY